MRQDTVTYGADQLFLSSPGALHVCEGSCVTSVNLKQGSKRLVMYIREMYIVQQETLNGMLTEDPV